MQEQHKEIIRRWVSALRSGEYKQGEAFLRRPDNCFCCLGVLCDLAVKDGVIQEAVLSHNQGWNGKQTAYAYEGRCDFLPTVVQNWAGLESDRPEVTFEHYDEETDQYDTLTEWVSELNDNGVSFESIADAIEAKYLKEDTK